MKRILSDGSSIDIKNNKKNKTNIEIKKDHWTNESVRIVKSIKCYVPKTISNVMKALNKKFISSEFSIFCIMDYNKIEKQFEVDDIYYIPKQKVSSASVDYLEDAPEGYNLVIHKHPRGYRSFSGTDDAYINQNFNFSLLWEGGNFVAGQARITTEYGQLSLPLDINEEDDVLPVIPLEQLKKIEEKVYQYKFPGAVNCNDYNGNLHNGFGGFGHMNNTSFKGRTKYNPVHILGKSSVDKGSLLNSEQEDAQQLLKKIDEEEKNFIEAKKEELQDYINDIEVIMAEKNVDWKTAEGIYLQNHKEILTNPLLDFENSRLENFRRHR